jgi:hypothetical protein
MLKISSFLRTLKSSSNLNLSKILFHTTGKLNGTQYYPINDDVFGLNEDQKQVSFFEHKIAIFFF